MDLLAGTFVGVAIVSLAWAVWRTWSLRPAKQMAEWQERVEAAAIECIRRDMDAALAKARLAELVGEMPATFEPGAWLACRVADGVHRAVVLEAERRGLIRAGVVGEIYAEAMPPQQDEQRTPSVPPPATRFVNGRLLPR